MELWWHSLPLPCTFGFEPRTLQSASNERRTEKENDIRGRYIALRALCPVNAEYATRCSTHAGACEVGWRRCRRHDPEMARGSHSAYKRNVSVRTRSVLVFGGYSCQLQSEVTVSLTVGLDCHFKGYRALYFDHYGQEISTIAALFNISARNTAVQR